MRHLPESQMFNRSAASPSLAVYGLADVCDRAVAGETGPVRFRLSAQRPALSLRLEQPVIRHRLLATADLLGFTSLHWVNHPLLWTDPAELRCTCLASTHLCVCDLLSLSLSLFWQ